MPPAIGCCARPPTEGWCYERRRGRHRTRARPLHVLRRAALLRSRPGRRGALDRLGQGRQLWNSHLGHGPGSDIAIPLLVSNTEATRCSSTNRVTPSSRSAAPTTVVRIDLHGRGAGAHVVFPDRRDLRGLMGEVAELLGRAPLPPRWALGFLQSTRHFDDTAELQRLPRTLREKRIPCDALIYLSSYGEAKGWNPRGSDTSSGSPSCGRSRRRCSTRCAVSISSSSRTSTPSSTSNRRSRRGRGAWLSADDRL